jgi:hypothetical protein
LGREQGNEGCDETRPQWVERRRGFLSGVLAKRGEKEDKDEASVVIEESYQNCYGDTQRGVESTTTCWGGRNEERRDLEKRRE